MCTLVPHEGQQVIYVAMRYFLFMLMESWSKEGPYQDRPPLCPFRL